MDTHTRRIGYVVLIGLAAYILAPNVWGSPQPKFRTTGLTNTGNFCYANSTFQALAALEQLDQWLAEQEHRDPVDETARSDGQDSDEHENRKQPTQWVAALREMLRVLRDESHESTHTTSITPLLRLMQHIMHKRISYAQQDAHEMLVHVIDLMESETGTKSPFAGMVTYTIQCLRCNHESVSQQRTLVLERQAGESILQPQTERITDYRCEACNTVSTIERTARMTEFPDILAVHINRSSMYNGQSFRTAEEADIPTHIGTYTLKSVVFHKGYHSRGHYTCARRKATQHNRDAAKRSKRTPNWWQISDESVKEVRTQQVTSRKKDAYLLFFEKRKLASVLDSMR